MAMLAARFWPETDESKASRDLALKPAAVPLRRAPARGQSAVGRGLGIRADTSTRHRSQRRRARALAMRPEGRVFFSGLAGKTKRRGQKIPLPIDRALFFPVPSVPVAILPVPPSPVPQAPDRRKVLWSARVSDLSKQFGPKMTLTKKVLVKMRTSDSTLALWVSHRFRLRRTASWSWGLARRASRSE